jgi:hypothetical protein
MRAKDAETEENNRTPVHFCVLLDNSGSMDMNGKIKNVKNSLKHIIDILGLLDRISIIAFSDVVEKVVERATVDNNQHKIAICNRIERIYPDGGTNLSAGILNARGCLQNGSGEKQGILLLTDGHANQGVTDEKGILRIVGSIIEEFPGTSISCVGYGLDHNAEMLRKIASVGGGSYNIVQDAEDVATVFGDILGGLSSCAFQQVEVKLPPGWKQITKYGEEGASQIIIGDLQTGNEAMIVARKDNNVTDVVESVHISAFDIFKTRPFNTTVEICNELTENNRRQGKIAILRCKVVEIIEEVRNGWTPCINIKVQTTKADIIRLKTEYTSPVLDLLLEELVFIENNSKELNCNHTNLQLSSVFSQHEAVIGTTRGIWQTPMNMRNNDPEDTNCNSSYDDPGHMLPSPNITACFSNSVQRRTSEQVRSYILPPPPPATRQIAVIMPNYSESGQSLDTDI